MLCDIQKLINSRPAGDNLRDHFEATFKQDVQKSSDFGEVEEFYQFVISQYEAVTDKDLDESFESTLSDLP